jgi:hypothetical protein
MSHEFPAAKSPMTVFCAYDQIVPLSVLDGKRNPKNPKQHGSAQVAAIAAVLEGNGWRQPIVISNRSGLMTKGHGRLDASLLLGYEGAPVDYQDYESEAAEIADMLADNRLPELGDVDEDKLLDVLRELQAAGHDVELSGFTEADIEKLSHLDEEIAQTEPIPKMELQAFEHYDYLIFLFRDIRDWLRVLQLLNVAKVDFSISRTTQKIGIGRVINGKALLNRLDAGVRPPADVRPPYTARDHVAGPGGQDENAPPGAAGDPGGPAERG